MAGTPATQTRSFRFGPFELDVRAGELRKHGIRIKLREQPVQILLMLLDHPGEVVLREEIRLRLWPNNTIVEFDHGINAAIQKLRDALGETADKPRYVETVARRGYRFLGEVERVGLTEENVRPTSVAQAGGAGTSACQPSVSDLQAGAVLSHYRIASKLGEGGMGVVYRAEDLKLGRQVALKFLARADGELPESVLRRFEREARAASALNHPHICTIYGLEDFGGQPAIVMELVEGETLAARLAKGPLPLDRSLALATQIAGALAEAHRRGIIHRDLKPANIMLTKSGAKVLDFGLAKMERTMAASADAETVTQKGAILGTLHYMSPEQVQGKETDARSDIFSFGLVLYEMVSGRRAFDGESAASVMAGILERAAPAVEPEGLNRVVRACLAKDPDDRFQSARDLQRAIEWSVAGSEAAAPLPSTFRKWIPWAAAAVFAALAVLVWLRMGPAGTAPTRLAFTIVPPAGAALLPVGSSSSAPEISPDGSSVLFAAAGGLWVRRLDSLEPKLLRGSRGFDNTPLWSADSRSVAFPAVGDLIRIRVPDGAPELISKLPGFTRGGTWSDSGTILISSLNRLYVGLASGGELRVVDVTGMKAGHYLYPQFLPGGSDFLFLLVPVGEEGGEVYLATLRGGKAINPILLMKNDTAAYYTPAGGGRILFVRSDNLYSQKLDRNGRKLEGDAELVQQGVASEPGAGVSHADFSVSRSGVAAWRPGRAALSQVTIFDRRGKEIGTAGPLSAAQSVLLSPDETRLLAFGDGSWLLSPGQSGGLPMGNAWRLWSPDGSRLIGLLHSGRLVERSVTGSGEVHELGAAAGILQDISPDGKQVLTMDGGIFTSHLDGVAQGRTPSVVENTGEFVAASSFSPDGRWIVYSVRSKASSGIYVQPFPGPGLRTQIPSAYGFPIWRKDGKEIEIADRRGVWSIRVEEAGGALRFGAPELLFSGLRFPAAIVASSHPLDVSRDGSRFYFPQAVEQPDSNVIHVRMGW